MRPDDFDKQLVIACNKAAGFLPEVIEIFKIANERGRDEVDRRLPRDV